MVLSPKIKNFLFYLGNSLTPIPFLLWKVIAIFDSDSGFLFRLTNILFHGLNSYLVFKLAQKVFDKTIKWAAWMCALIYLAHPVQVESVVWISSLKTLLASTFSLSFLLLCLREELQEKDRNQSFSQAILAFTPALFCYFLALLSNPTCAPIVVVPLILLRLLERRPTPAFFQISLFTFLTALMIFIGHKADVLTTYFDQLSLILRVKLIFVSLSTYLLNLFYPFQLTFDYQINPLSISYLDETSQIAGLLMIGPMAFLTSMALLLKPKTKNLGLLFLIFFVLLTPHIGVVLHDFNNISIVSDRYLNLAMVGFSLSVTFMLLRVIAFSQKHFEKLPSFSVPTFVLFVFSLVTLFQVARWKDPKSLLKSSQNLLELRDSVLVALGNQFFQEENYRQARISLKEALAANPKSTAALFTLIKINERSPIEVEGKFIMDFIKTYNINLTLDMYIPLTKLYLRFKKFNEASNLLETFKTKNLRLHHWKDINSISKVLKNRKKVYALEAHKVLETYYASELKYSKALEQVQEILKIAPAEKEYLKKAEDYKLKK